VKFIENRSDIISHAAGRVFWLADDSKPNVVQYCIVALRPGAQHVLGLTANCVSLAWGLV
jgi:hypothetical protein